MDLHVSPQVSKLQNKSSHQMYILCAYFKIHSVKLHNSSYNILQHVLDFSFVSFKSDPYDILI